MKRKIKTQFILSLSFLAMFVLFTLTLKFVDVKTIGPNSSSVAYSTVNKVVHEIFGVNVTLYNITDWAGLAVLFIMLGFAVLGLVQWIKRKNILKVDSSILVLGVYYIVLFLVYIFFEYNVINRRPVLINGFLESSYPSSTTMLCLCVLPTAMMQFRRLIKNVIVRNTVNFVCGLFTAFMVLCRLVSGVHWFTDIVGGTLFSVGFVLLYYAANNFLKSLDCLTKKPHER